MHFEYLCVRWSRSANKKVYYIVVAKENEKLMYSIILKRGIDEFLSCEIIQCLHTLKRNICIWMQVE